MILINPLDAAARVRAAIGYSGLEYDELERKTRIGKSTLARIAARSGKPRGASRDELWKIADACRVPRDFMDHGFLILQGGSSTERDIRSSLDDVQGRLRELEEKVRELVTRDARRELEARQQSDEAPGTASSDAQPLPPPGEPGERAQSDEPEEPPASAA